MLKILALINLISRKRSSCLFGDKGNNLFPKNWFQKTVSLNLFYIGLWWWSKIIIILCVRESTKTQYVPQGKEDPVGLSRWNDPGHGWPNRRCLGF